MSSRVRGFRHGASVHGPCANGSLATLWARLQPQSSSTSPSAAEQGGRGASHITSTGGALLPASRLPPSYYYCCGCCSLAFAVSTHATVLHRPLLWIASTAGRDNVRLVVSIPLRLEADLNRDLPASVISHHLRASWRNRPIGILSTACEPGTWIPFRVSLLPPRWPYPGIVRPLR